MSVYLIVFYIPETPHIKDLHHHVLCHCVAFRFRKSSWKERSWSYTDGKEMHQNYWKGSGRNSIYLARSTFKNTFQLVLASVINISMLCNVFFLFFTLILVNAALDPRWKKQVLKRSDEVIPVFGADCSSNHLISSFLVLKLIAVTSW